jgi:hypothetical protein
VFAIFVSLVRGLCASRSRLQLENLALRHQLHLRDMISVDFFVVPTVRNQVLYVFLVLSNERRRVLHFNVTTNPTAEWTGRRSGASASTT